MTTTFWRPDRYGPADELSLVACVASNGFLHVLAEGPRSSIQERADEAFLPLMEVTTAARVPLEWFGTSVGGDDSSWQFLALFEVPPEPAETLIVRLATEHGIPLWTVPADLVVDGAASGTTRLWQPEVEGLEGELSLLACVASRRFLYVFAEGPPRPPPPDPWSDTAEMLWAYVTTESGLDLRLRGNGGGSSKRVSIYEFHFDVPPEPSEPLTVSMATDSGAVLWEVRAVPVG